jgi:chaperone modulatory protein CbpM
MAQNARRVDERNCRMTELFTDDEVIMIVTRLNRQQLGRYVEADLVRPLSAEEGIFFRKVDIARLELLCDLAQDLDLDEGAVGIVVSLVDQLHGTRRELVMLTEVIQTLPTDLQSRIVAALQQA